MKYTNVANNSNLKYLFNFNQSKSQSQIKREHEQYLKHINQ